MASFALPIAGAIGNVLGGILGGNAAKKAGNYVNYVAQNAGQSMQNATSGASQNTGQVAAAGSQTIQNAAQAAQAGVGSAVTQGQGGVGQAQQGGVADVNGATQNANQVLGNIYGGQLQMEQPYLQAGSGATQNLQNLTANGGFKLPTAEDVQNTPGFQFQLQNGLNGLEQQFGATGAGATGGALKGLTQYGQGLASTYYQNAVQNATGAYNTNINANMGVAGLGQNAAAQTNQAAENAGNQVATNTTNAGYYAGNTGNTAAQYNAGLGLEGSTAQGNFGLGGAQAAGNLNFQGALQSGNQWLQGTQAANNYYVEGAGANAAGTLGQAAGVNQAIGGATNAIGFGLQSWNPWGAPATSSATPTGYNASFPYA